MVNKIHSIPENDFLIKMNSVFVDLYKILVNLLS